MDQRRVPNLLIAGVIKAGTTSLYAYLTQHPQICPPDWAKEIDFFTPMRWGNPPEGSVADYASYFDACTDELFRLDASPQYFDGGPALVEAVRTFSPEAHVIIVLRDPVARIWSQFRSNRANGKLPRGISFEEYFERGAAVYTRGRGRLQQVTGYRGVSLGCYTEFLDDWFDVFGNRVRITFFEHLKRDPLGVVQDTCAWLDLDPEPASTFDYMIRNRTVDPRSVALSKVGFALNRSVGPHLNRLPRTKRAVRATYALFNRQRRGEGLSDRDRRLAEDFYRPANKALHAELSARGYTDLPTWVSAGA